MSKQSEAKERQRYEPGGDLVSRVIKFRAWDGERMFVPTVIPNPSASPDHHGGSLMQFTGLLDKKGKEVFEGDIIKQSFGKHFWISQVKSLGGQFGNCLFAVELYNNLSQDSDKGIYTYQVSTENSGTRNLIPSGKDVEIIGNIYEHPELMEASL